MKLVPPAGLGRNEFDSYCDPAFPVRVPGRNLKVRVKPAYIPKCPFEIDAVPFTLQDEHAIDIDISELLIVLLVGSTPESNTLVVPIDLDLKLGSAIGGDAIVHDWRELVKHVIFLAVVPPSADSIRAASLDMVGMLPFRFRI